MLFTLEVKVSYSVFRIIISNLEHYSQGWMSCSRNSLRLIVKCSLFLGTLLLSLGGWIHLDNDLFFPIFFVKRL